MDGKANVSGAPIGTQQHVVTAPGRQDAGVMRGRCGARGGRGSGCFVSVTEFAAHAGGGRHASAQRRPRRRSTLGVSKRRVDRTRTRLPAGRGDRHRPLWQRADPISSGRVRV